MNNKGFVDNIYLLIIFIVSFFVIAIIGFIYTQLTDKVNTNAFINSSEEVTNMITTLDNNQANNDNLLSVFFGGMIIVIFVSLYFLRSNPVFFIIGIIGLVIVVFLAILLKGAFTDILDSNADFRAEADSNVKSSFIFDYLPIILLIIFSVFLIVAYVNRGGTIQS